MVWAGDPRRYPILSRQDRHDIVFGAGAVRRDDAEVNGPFERLERLGEIWIQDRQAFDPVRGWRVIPRVAIEVVRGWIAKQTGTG